MLRQRPAPPVTRLGRLLGCALLLGALGCPPGRAAACTLFGLAGPADVAGGGTIIVKNRDWRPDQTQSLSLVTPEDGYRYLGLFAVGGGADGLKAGVNEKGLAAVTATVSSIPREERKAEKGISGILRRLLAQCASVEEAVARADLFANAKPCFYMLADRHGIARVETAPGGKFAVTRLAAGPLWQTNHYLEPALAADNRRLGASSQARAARIQALLAQVGKPASLDALLAVSRDTAGGPDNGIWRTGSTPTATRTMATFAVALPASGTATLYLRTADPGAPERVLSLKLPENAPFPSVDKKP
ncbi:MAG: C45 family autoproteolytic acyltransferase/hydrolase [Solidesulfovibrio sp. DCME]|uniref:C45 family autoproteolytic acyltransferase/hydolase n=1 Tax=Solidesulfovibrio sp. DCME TaxID=3447380 RepID=UPI003D0A214A